jgi:hypothetical protein
VRIDRREPALDAAEQPVVILVLIVRLMRLPHDRPVPTDREDREAPPAVAVVPVQVLIDLQIVPARGEGGPVGERADGFERDAHGRRVHEGITRVGDRLVHVDRCTWA